MAGLLTRIYLGHAKGATLSYIYSREVTEQLFPPNDPSTNSQNLRIGDILSIDGEDKVVTDIRVVLFPERYGNDTSVGVDLYSADGITPYDMSIVIIVDNT